MSYSNTSKGDKGNEKQLQLYNFIEKQSLQRLLNSFSTATNLLVSVTDVEGNCLLTSEQGESDFCRLVKSTPLGLERCRGSYARAGKQATKWDEPYIFRCHAGLITWVCPVLYRGNHIGNFVCGQVLMWEPEDFFWIELQEFIKDLEKDEQKYLEAAMRLKVVSAESIQAAADILFIVANYIGQCGIGFLNYQLKLRTIGSWLWGEYNKQKSAQNTAADSWHQNLLDLESQIFREIRQFNITAAKNLLDKLVLQFFVQSRGQIEIIKGLCVEFISHLARLATESGLKFEDSMTYSLLKIKELEEADTVEKVFLWLLTICDYYVDILSKNVDDHHEKLVTKAISYIEENYQMQGLSLKDVAEATYTSPAYLSRLFKKEKGVTLTDYLNNIRIEKAKMLLQHNKKTIEEIASEVGYKDRSYFCKIFKQIVGVSPKEYRNRLVVL